MDYWDHLSIGMENTLNSYNIVDKQAKPLTTLSF